ncbi:hypothetical protein V6N11_069194 [Hibiscus sabdariffa]|uniref:Uncharacterized protein n=1 Tax=Hibiscus sabdariffa TaxID=183260 RepID=A0ABR2NAZ1_9ROSI
MSGFGKHSGPASAPKSGNPFQFQRPPPPSTTPPIRPSRLNEAVDRLAEVCFSFFELLSSVIGDMGPLTPDETPRRWDDDKIPLKDYDAQATCCRIIYCSAKF